MTPECGAVVAEKYELVEELGRGGMGSVWRARHLQLDTDVAVKFMGSEIAHNPEAHARFEREAKAAARLRSPQVVQILDYGFDDDTPYITMELLDGEDLQQRLQRVRQLDLVGASVVLTEVCRALALAAGAGIVHRDLKPANIFIATSGEEEIVKVLDFGLAKARMRLDDHESTASGTIMGSVPYMSPEQAAGGNELDVQSDLWAAAAVAYRAITGSRPFPGNEVIEVALKICTQKHVPPRDVAPELPAEFDRFFERAFKKDPAQRFPSPRQMAMDFANIVAAHTDDPTAVARVLGGLPRASRGSLSGDDAEPETRRPVDVQSGTFKASALATRGSESVHLPMAGRRSSVWIAALVALVAVGVLVFAVRQTDTVAPASGKTSTTSAEPPATVVATSSPTPAPAPTAAPSAMSSAAPSASTRAAAPPPRRPQSGLPKPRVAHPVEPKKPAKTADKPMHPVLGL